MSYLIILVALFALMWFLLIWPQRRRQAEQTRMQEVIEPGDEILTAGGIHGIVREVEDELVHVEIAPGTTIRLDRRAVAAIESEPEPDEPDELEESEEPQTPEETEPEAEKVANPGHPAKGDGS